MSATLRLEDFTFGTRIFSRALPVIKVPTRQFPVTMYFFKRTHENYIGQVYKKVLDIHKKLPPGGILIFVTGQREVENLCHKLRIASTELVEKNSKRNDEDASVIGKDEIDGHDMKDIDKAFEACGDSTQLENGRFSSFDEYHSDSDIGELQGSDMSDTESELEFNDDDDRDNLNQKTSEADNNLGGVSGDESNLDSLKAAFEALAGNSASRPECKENHINSVTLKGCSQTSDPSLKKKKEDRVFVLCVSYPFMPQLRVFGDTKEGKQLVVVATNVAETSLTIRGIKYVVDTGKERVKNFNTSTGMESYNVQWISKASTDQRAGRTGRTGPGHCYCLYSAAAFGNEFPDFSGAEISKIPVEDVVLLMKTMDINANVVVEAECCLKVLEELDVDGRLTSLGNMMAQYPLNPRHSHMLFIAVETMRKEDHGEKSDPSDNEKTPDKQEKQKRKRLEEAVRLARAKFAKH